LEHPWAPGASRFDDETVEQLLELTGRHPDRLQRAAFHRFEAFYDPVYDWRAMYRQHIGERA
jgi:hypothetical protein